MAQRVGTRVVVHLPVDTQLHAAAAISAVHQIRQMLGSATHSVIDPSPFTEIRETTSAPVCVVIADSDIDASNQNFDVIMDTLQIAITDEYFYLYGYFNLIPAFNTIPIHVHPILTFF